MPETVIKADYLTAWAGYCPAHLCFSAVFFMTDKSQHLFLNSTPITGPIDCVKSNLCIAIELAFIRYALGLAFEGGEA